ncbi:MAG: AraC family transcriptional regulator [Chitinophagaceae bacterium]
MKIEFELIQEDEGSSFRLLHDKIPAEEYSWQYHYHPEFEIVCVLAGNGTRQVGNHASNYENGDLVLMGPDLPHSGFGLNTRGTIEQIVVQFKKDVFGPGFLARPEMKHISLLLEKSSYGISFGDATKEKVMKRMMRLPKISPFERFVELTHILQLMATSEEYTLLNSQITLPNTIRKVHVRLQNIFNYVEQNYQEEINIKKVAAIAHLTVPAFCNYFKKIMNITFTDFINQYRIEQACIMLQQEKSIGQVCFECGFNNVPYFNKVFKAIVKKTPSEFKKTVNSYQPRAAVVTAS